MCIFPHNLALNSVLLMTLVLISSQNLWLKARIKTKTLTPSFEMKKLDVTAHETRDRGLETTRLSVIS